MRFCTLLLPALVYFAQAAQAVVVASGGPNNTAPAGQPFFDNVGTVNGSSAIYLADGWVLTANHVAGSLPATATFGGISYGTQAGSFQRLANPAYSPTLSVFSDIVLFRLNAPLGLPGIEISAATPTVGSQVMMIGNGRTQWASPTFWNRTEIPGDGNDTWVEVPEISSNIAGFQTTGTREIRWGENSVNATGFTVNMGTVPSPIDVIAFSTQFDDGALAEEAQAVSGDSGGAAFQYNGSSWDLAGMMFAVSTYETQPDGAGSAVFGVETAIADLSYYRAEILSIIPEPSAAALAMLGALGFLRRRR